MSNISALRSRIRRDLKHLVYMHPGVNDSDGRDNPDISFLAYAKKNLPAAIDMIKEEIGADVIVRNPDETETMYERRLIIEQAARESRRAEAKAEKKLFLKVAIVLVILDIIVGWVCALTCSQVPGYDHPAVITASFATVVVLAVMAIICFVKYNEFYIPE